MACSEKAKTTKNHIIKDKSNTVSEICINGHVYYYLSAEGMAVKVNDNGFPVKCVKIKGLEK